MFLRENFCQKNNLKNTFCHLKPLILFVYHSYPLATSTSLAGQLSVSPKVPPKHIAARFHLPEALDTKAEIPPVSLPCSLHPKAYPGGKEKPQRRSIKPIPLLCGFPFPVMHFLRITAPKSSYPHILPRHPAIPQTFILPTEVQKSDNSFGAIRFLNFLTP